MRGGLGSGVVIRHHFDGHVSPSKLLIPERFACVVLK
jgi:hypothetical protein